MISLQEREWKPFKLYELFETQQYKGGFQLPTGANIRKEELEDGDIARITVTSTNNGIYGFYKSENKNHRVFENIISVSFLGDCFYHPYKCSLDMKVHCLKLKDREWNKYTALFFITQLLNNTKQANYGNQLSSTDAPYKSIMVPVTDNGNPDYDFMELYMRERERVILDKYKSHKFKED